MRKVIQYLSFGEIKNELLIALLLTPALVFIPLTDFTFLPVIILIISLLFFYKERFLIAYAIITLLTVTTTISPSVRTFIQVSDTLLLGFFFLKNYGLNFKIYPKVPAGLLVFLICLLGLMLLSSVNSNFNLGIIQALRLSLFLVIVYLLYSLASLGKNNYKLIIKSFYIIAAVYGSYLIYDFAGSDFNILQYNLKQVAIQGNEYLSKNFMGSFFSIIITLSVSYLFFFRKPLIKYYLSGIIILSVLSLIILNSRTSILTSVIGLFYIVYVFNKKLIKWILSSLAACTLLLLTEPVYQLFEIYFRLERISTGRDAILLSALNVIKENWFLGAGPAGTKYEFYKNLPFMLGSPVEQFIRFHYNEIEFGHAHNFYLFFFSDLGIFGFILSLLFPVLFFRYGNKALKKTVKNSFEYSTTVGILASGLCLFIRGIFEWGGLISYGTINYDLPFWLLFIILIGFYMHNEKDYQAQ